MTKVGYCHRVRWLAYCLDWYTKNETAVGLMVILWFINVTNIMTVTYYHWGNWLLTTNSTPSPHFVPLPRKSSGESMIAGHDTGCRGYRWLPMPYGSLSKFVVGSLLLTAQTCWIERVSRQKRRLQKLPRKGRWSRSGKRSRLKAREFHRTIVAARATTLCIHSELLHHVPCSDLKLHHPVQPPQDLGINIGKVVTSSTGKMQ